MITPLEPVDSPAPKKVDPIDNFTENLQLFWFKHQSTIYTIVILLVLAVVGKGVFDWNTERVARQVGEEYAAAGASVDKLKAFAAAHEGNQLAGVAHLRIADEAYSLNKYTEAAAAYELAFAALKDSPFAHRARLGLALSNLLSGKTTEGLAALRILAEDANSFKGLRAEAAYNLVSASVDAGKVEEAKKFCDLLLQVDGSGVWAQRALALRATLPEDPAPAAPASESGSLKLNLPLGK